MTAIGPVDMVYSYHPDQLLRRTDSICILSHMLTDVLHGCAGIDDPYEAPERPEITLDVDDPQGRRQSPEAMARIILAYLEVCHASSHSFTGCHVLIALSTPWWPIASAGIGA